MKYNGFKTVLFLMAAAIATTATAFAQNTTHRNRVVVRDGVDKDPNRTPNAVTTEEYEYALDSLDGYLGMLNIAPEDIAVYNISDDNRLTLQFHSERPDTTLQIPPDVDFPPYLVADYAATQLAHADQQVARADAQLARADAQRERVAKQLERANKQLERANRRLERAQRRTTQVHTFSTIDSGNYQQIVLSDSVAPGTVKTVSVKKESDGKINVSINGQESTFNRHGKKKRAVAACDDDDDDDWDDIFDDDDYDKFSQVIKSVATYRTRNFRGHWAGFEVGFNWLLSPSGSFALTGEQTPLRMNHGTSFNFNLNFIQYSVPLWRANFGVLTGLGFNFNNYRFKNKNTMVTGEHGITFNSDLQDAGHKVRSSRFFNWALTAPLLLELQSKGNGYRRVYISTGVLLNIRLHSSTKLLYDKNRENYASDTFNLNDVSFAPTLRLGIGAVRLYTNFYPMGLFEKGMGPEVLPVEMGIVLLPF